MVAHILFEVARGTDLGFMNQTIGDYRVMVRPACLMATEDRTAALCRAVAVGISNLCNT